MPLMAARLARAEAALDAEREKVRLSVTGVEDLVRGAETVLEI